MRRSWDEQGVPKERQDGLIADVTAKAQPWAKVGPFALGSGIEGMRQSLKTGVQVITAPQLFSTPPALAARMVELAGIEEMHRVLEPSAGTGNILRLIGDAPDKVAVEINGQLVRRLLTLGLSGLHVHHGDFLDCNHELGTFDRILMNPPFTNGQDIKHIIHALRYLSPPTPRTAAPPIDPNRTRASN